MNENSLKGEHGLKKLDLDGDNQLETPLEVTSRGQENVFGFVSDKEKCCVVWIYDYWAQFSEEMGENFNKNCS